MVRKKYNVLSGVKKLIIVEGKNLSKSKANVLARKISGYYCGPSEHSVKTKTRKPIKGKYCERVRTKILIDN